MACIGSLECLSKRWGGDTDGREIGAMRFDNAVAVYDRVDGGFLSILGGGVEALISHHKRHESRRHSIGLMNK